MGSGIFITGTDTGIGKTHVSVLLIRELINKGLKVAVMKPVASGATLVDGILKNEDALQLVEAANVRVEYELVNPYCFEPAIAPHIAAQQVDIQIDFDHIKSTYDQIAAKADVVIIEGVGGSMVPLNNDQTVSDMIKYLGIPALLIIGMRLGCLNHAFLTERQLLSEDIKLTGWVANTLESDMPRLKENMETLKTMMTTPLIGSVPYKENFQVKQNENLFDLTQLEIS